MSLLHRFWMTLDARGERGASLVEYALLVALIALICVGALSLLGESASQNLSSAGSGLGN